MSNRISCVIVDDEERSRNYLFKIIGRYCPELLILGTAANMKEGIELINREQPQLIFLDIEMPDGTGFEVLKEITPYDYEVIFVTGYNDHAIRAIKVDALDYLLKPLDTDELKAAVRKASQKINKSIIKSTDFSELIQKINHQNDTLETDKLAIPTSKGIDFVFIKNIIFCEAQKNYTTFHLSEGKTLVSSKNIGEYEKKLPLELTTDSSRFFRAHKSYLVNLFYLKSYDNRESYLELTNGKKIPIAQRRRSDFLKIMR